MPPNSSFKSQSTHLSTDPPTLPNNTQQQDKVAAAVSDAVRGELGTKEGEQEVTVIFTQIEKKDYYENGTHF